MEQYLVKYLVKYLAMTFLLTARAVNQQICAQPSLRLRLRRAASTRLNIRSAVILVITTACRTESHGKFYFTDQN